MNEIIIWIIIFVASIILGAFHYKAGYNKELEEHNFYYKSLEFLRHFINYFLTLIIVYYFVSIRLTTLTQGNNFHVSDFILGIIFLIGIFGWLPYFIKNITEGINAIITKILK